MPEQLIEQIAAGETFGYLLVFARIGAAMSLLPGFSVAYVSVRIRLILALAIALVVVPVLAPTLPAPPPTTIGLALLIGGEVSIGVFIAVIARIVVAALQIAGTLIAGLVYNIGLGLLGRLMPQLPVFFFGLPLQISFQIWTMALTISGIMMVFLNRFSGALMPYAAP